MEAITKKFFVRLLGYEPKLYNVSDTSKKIKEIIEDYLRTINVEINDRIMRTFSYNGNLINLNATINDLNLEHLSFITSDFSE